MPASSAAPIFDFSSNVSLDFLKRFCLDAQLNSTGGNELPTTTTTANLSALSAFDRPTPTKVWGVGLLFVTIISCCAAGGIALMPLLSRRTYRRVLIFFIGLGVGSLSGSAVFHLLPQAWGLIDAEGVSHEYLAQAWMTIFGIYLFFLVDKFLKLIMEYRKRRKAKANQRVVDRLTYGFDPEGSKMTELAAIPKSQCANGGLLHADQEADIPQRPVQHCDTTLSPSSECHAETSSDAFLARAGVTTVDVLKDIQRMCSHDHEVHFDNGESVIATVAWMIIFGDGLHNFIDGLSIGTAFTDSILSGISVSVAVLCEEFPHELGDVAILVSAGMTLRQALLYNLLSAATCYLGFFLGVIVGEFAAAQTMIFALAGGMFLYISLGSMVPEMNATMEKSMNVSLWYGFRVLVLQSTGILSGLIIMFFMSRYGPEIQFS